MAGDLPDWSAGHRITQLPIISINQPVLNPTYDSGLIDVGAYASLIVNTFANSANSVFEVDITFYKDSLGSALTYVRKEKVFLYGQATYFLHAYSVSARYVEVTASEITATGGNLAIRVIPSVGQAAPIDAPGGPAINFEASIPSLGSITFDTQAIVRGVYLLFARTHAPQWGVILQRADAAAIWRNIFSVTNLTSRMPVAIEYALTPGRYQVTFSNNWAYPAQGLCGLIYLRPLSE